MTSLRLSLALALVSLPGFSQVSPAINFQPSREFGHPRLLTGTLTNTPNLIEGRELNSPVAIAFDTTSSPPVVYVADTANHRVLGWKNPANLAKGNPADKVIGQRDFSTALPGGPGASPSTPALTASGLLLPNGLAVDSSGDLWVLDAGNNRIVRFQRPMEQRGDFVSPNLVVGQKQVSAGIASNQNQARPSDKTLSFNRGGSVTRGTITFDSQGNLWVADTLNNRVLRFPKARLTANEPAADLVLGQAAFDADTAGNSALSLSTLAGPVGLAVDERGAVYVSDFAGSFPRVLYFDSPSIGASAARILGIDPQPTATNPAKPAPNDYTLGRSGTQGSVIQCLYTLGSILFVCDNAANRIVRYGSPESWPPIQTSPTAILSPPITAAYGQNSLFEGGINRGNGLSRPGNTTMYSPTSMAIYNNELWVVDTGNNRVLSFASTGPFNFPVATRVLGQLDYDLNAANLVEGRELFVAGGGYRGSSIAIDRRSNPNRLYVADSLNNRVLGFKDVRAVGVDSRTLLTQVADVVIGQQDRFHTGVNYPTYDQFIPTDQGFNTPSGVAVDDAGNVWVADTLNGRILRFPDPFALPPGTVPRANLVLGQFSFSDSIKDASSSTMSAPVGVTVLNNGDVAAADFNHNRILLWHKNGPDYSNGQPARAVLGQSNFGSVAESNSASGLFRPRGLASDTSGRLYVADSANNRVVVYAGPATAPNGATGIVIPGINSPEGVAVSPNSGEIWATSYSDQRIYRYREFSQLVTNPGSTADLSAAVPIGIALDSFDNIIAIEATNRMTFYFARAVYQHAATYASGTNLGSTLTPNQYTILYRAGKSFEFEPATASIPYPKTLNGLQLLVAGIPAPITSIQKESIYFLVPNDAPTSGFVEYLLQRPATGEVIAAGNFIMGAAAPGFFTLNQQGTGQIAAINEDGTVNGSANRIGQGQVLSLYLTGYGHMDNHPPDGEAATAPISTPVAPVIIIGGAYRVPPENILYSGLSSYPGLWQINVRMPKNGEPGAPLPTDRVSILIQMWDVPSNIGGTNVVGQDRQLTIQNNLITTIAMK